MAIILFYDIEGQKARLRTSKYLERKGFMRVQFSVFLGTPSTQAWVKISERLRHIWETTAVPTDKIFWITIGEKQIENMDGYGPLPNLDELTGKISTIII